jgi:hypothetical protein
MVNHVRANKGSLLVATTLGCWGAIPFMALLAFVGRSHRMSLSEDGVPISGGNGRAWFIATLVMTAVVAGMIAVAAVDASSALRKSGSSGRVERTDYVVGLVLSGLMWLFGGLFSIVALYVTGECGDSVGSPCVDQPGSILSVLFKACLILPTVLVATMPWLAQRSRVCAFLMPPIIACTYLLAVHLQLPHAGFGDVTS